MWLGWFDLVCVVLHAVGFVLMVTIFYTMTGELVMLWCDKKLPEEGWARPVLLVVGFFLYTYFRGW